MPGFFKSPDKPTPAVIPVNAGKTIANTIKNFWGFIKALSNNPTEPETLIGLPRKKKTSEINKTATTIYNAFTPRLAPLKIINNEENNRCRYADNLPWQVYSIGTLHPFKEERKCFCESYNIKSNAYCLENINRAIPIVAPIFNPNDREIIKYSPPPSTFWLVAISEIASAVGIVTKCPMRTIKNTRKNPRVPTANPNRRKRIAAKNCRDSCKENRCCYKAIGRCEFGSSSFNILFFYFLN